MEDERLKKFVKICFRFSVIIGIVLFFYLVVGVFFLDFPINAWFLFFFGIASLLYVPKLHLGVIEEERKCSDEIDPIGKKVCFGFLLGGCMLILAAVYDIFLR